MPHPQAVRAHEHDTGACTDAIGPQSTDVPRRLISLEYVTGE